MPLSPTRLVIPSGLTTLLEGVSRAAVVTHPEDIADFFTLYFQGLATFRREHPDLELAELVEYFEHMFLGDTVSEGGEEPSDSSVPCKDRQKLHKCTDTEEDQLLEEPDSQYSSTLPQHPSSTGSFAESTSPPASEGAVSPVGAVLAYVPAEPDMLATHMLGNSSSSCSVRHVATSVQTLPTTSQASGDECMPGGGSEAASDISQLSVRDAATSVQSLHTGSQASEDEHTAVESDSESASVVSVEETAAEDVRSETESEFPAPPGAGEDAAAAPAAEGSVESVTSHAEVSSVSSTAGDFRPLGSLAGSSATAAHEASKATLWEEPSASPAPNDPSWPLPPCNQAEVTSTTGVVSQHWPEEPDMDVELPPYIEQFPRRILIPFVDQTAYLLERSPGLSLLAAQSVTTLVPSEDLGAHPEGAEPTAQVEPAEQACTFSAMASSGEQPQAYPNVWTIYCLTDLSQDPTPTPTLPPGQALSLPSGAAQQLAAGAAPAYVMEEQSSMGTAPPFILVGSNLQSREHWNPIPNCAVFTQQDRGARRRFTTIPVPVAVVAEEAPGRAGPQRSSAEAMAAERRTPRVGTVAVPLAELMAARRGSQAGVSSKESTCVTSCLGHHPSPQGAGRQQSQHCLLQLS